MESISLRPETRQQQSLSPQQQRAVRLLQLSSLDFAHSVYQSLDSNPFLEGEDLDGEPSGDYADPNATAVGTMDAADDSDRELWQAEAYAPRNGAGHTDLAALDGMAVESTLAQHLQSQLALRSLAPRERLLSKVIVESLDDDGYLRSGLDELRGITGLRPRATLKEMEAALERVQALDPAGVGARGVGECLYLQLQLIECPRMRELAAIIIEQHLEQLAAHDLRALCKQLDRPAAEVAAACDRIRHFDPRPGWRHGSGGIAYVVPDVIVRQVRGAWTVQLNPAVVPKVRLNQVYADLFQRAGAERNPAMASHLQEARWTLRTVEHRFCTILDVARAIVRRQRRFLDLGPMAMKPLGLREIAEELGMHESTVSRVTNNKYLAAPSGVFELKHFFSRAMLTAGGSPFTGTAIRGLVRDLIEVEDPAAPLSDAEIARQLARQGLKLARRTITKYRQSLRIDPVDRRRRLAEAALVAPA